MGFFQVVSLLLYSLGAHAVFIKQRVLGQGPPSLGETLIFSFSSHILVVSRNRKTERNPVFNRDSNIANTGTY